MRISKSTKVSGYVNAVLKHNALAGRLQTQEEKLLPLRRKVTEAKADMLVRRNKMNIRQIHEANRILKGEPEPPAVSSAAEKGQTS